MSEELQCRVISVQLQESLGAMKAWMRLPSLGTWRRLPKETS